METTTNTSECMQTSVGWMKFGLWQSATNIVMMVDANDSLAFSSRNDPSLLTPIPSCRAAEAVGHEQMQRRRQPRLTTPENKPWPPTKTVVSARKESSKDVDGGIYQKGIERSTSGRMDRNCSLLLAWCDKAMGDRRLLQTEPEQNLWFCLECGNCAIPSMDGKLLQSATVACPR